MFCALVIGFSLGGGGGVFMVLIVTRAKVRGNLEAASSSGLCAMAAVPLRPGSLRTKHEFA